MPKSLRGKALILHLGAVVWFASALDHRLSALEAQLPPGFIQRLDERTVDQGKTLAHIEKLLEAPR